MNLQLPDLPVLSAVPALKAALADAGRAVLAAPPGSGKTTLLPLCLLDQPWLRGQRIVMLEPRRIAARAAAARMAWLLGESVGETVGYQIRFERRIGAHTRIEVVTEGLLARRLQADPELPGVGLVIFDEFHERSLDADLALALTLDVRANLRPELRLLVMSATLDTARVSALLGAAPVVTSAGQLHPVDIHYLAQRQDADHAEAVAQGVLTALGAGHGDILAFLPGGREIRACQRRIEERAGRALRVHPLYGDLSSQAQDAALMPARDGARKVILATNIAQTSLTVEGVSTVVDGGLVRVARFDLGAGANRLHTQRVSRASADQRAGRAGRLGPGACYRLWSREQHASLPAADTPEILLADLSGFALDLACWGVSDPAALALLDAPAGASWSHARELLAELGALDARGGVTAHGRALARLPATPRRGHMLLLAQAAGLGGLAAWVAAVLDERDGGGADLATAVEHYVQGRAADAASLRRVRDSARQLARLIQADAQVQVQERDVARVVGWAYPERIARRREGLRGRDWAYLCADGGEARIAEHDALAKAEWLAIAHWDPGPPRRPRLAVRLQQADLVRDQADRLEDIDDVHWDAPGGAVVAERQRRLGAIVLERRPLREGAGAAVRAALLQGLRALGLPALPWTDGARQWQARVLSLRAWRPGEDWPDVSDAALLDRLDHWLGPHLDGMTRIDHLARLDLGAILALHLDYPRQQALERLAPTHLPAPTGSRIRLEYRPPEPPLLSVKLQEMFGCGATPAVNDGRTPVVLQLLSPAQRPVAVTRDLAGFWSGAYADGKKDVKGRYPRHPWPDDPRAAQPTRRAKPRGT